GDTWEWDGTSWALRASTGPSPRAEHAMAYDGARARSVIIGGSDSTNAEAWEWDGSTWLQTASGPSGRGRLAIAYDSARHNTVLFGGFGAFCSPYGGCADKWVWDG